MIAEEQGPGPTDADPEFQLIEAGEPEVNQEESVSRREAKNEILIAALAAGKNYADAAELAGVDRRTVARRMQLPEFARRVSQGRGGCFESSCRRNDRRLPRRQESKVRLAAAKLLVEMDLRARRINDIERELAEIRRVLAEEV